MKSWQSEVQAPWEPRRSPTISRLLGLRTSLERDPVPHLVIIFSQPLVGLITYSGIMTGRENVTEGGTEHDKAQR